MPALLAASLVIVRTAPADKWEVALTNTSVAAARPFIIEPSAEVRREVRRVRRRTGL